MRVRKYHLRHTMMLASSGLATMAWLSGTPAFAAGPLSITPDTVKLSGADYAEGSAHTITAKNISGAAVPLGAISFTGPDAGDFATVSDGCSNHTIAYKKNCKIRIAFNASAPLHSTETATLSINDPGASALGSVALTGNVANKQVWATISGLTITLYTQTQYQYDLYESFDGPFYDTGNDSCGSIFIGNHGMGEAKVASCTIVLGRNGNGPGELDLEVAGDIDGGKSYDFSFPLN
jgi:hypothetical protein